MGASHTIDVGQLEIVALGTLPPPVTGMTLVTEQVVRALQQTGPVTFFDWSTGISRRGLKFRVARVLRTVRSLFWLLRHGRATNARLYLVANSKAGLYLTAIVVWIARRLNYTVYLHHHTYYYIDQYDWRASWINRMLGRHGVHVVHTPQMAADFGATYPTLCPFAFVYPSVVPVPLGAPRQSIREPVVVGHLSNLHTGKGLDLVLATCQQLRRRGRPVRLKLAGDFLNQEARRIVDEAVAESDGAVEYVGPVYGEQKAKFFASIDFFVFPTRSESWGIVLHEAMAAGLPVIAYDRGCTRTVVGDEAGLIVSRDLDFPLLAARQIEAWMDEPHVYRAASEAAVQQAARLEHEGRRTLDEFVALMFSPAHAANNLHRSPGVPSGASAGLAAQAELERR